MLGFELGAPVRFHAFDFVGCHHLFGNQTLGIEFKRRLVRADDFIHQRLREGRLVAFIVTEAAIAEHINHNGLMEPLTEFRGDFRRKHHRFRIIAVAMENRRLDHLRHIGRIGRGARIARIGGEADLVIDDEVDRAAGAMAFQARQTQTFRHYALTRKGGIAMDQQRHDGGAFALVLMLVLLGAHFPQYHRIHNFKMRGIGCQRQMHGIAVKHAVRRGAQMIFHIARSLDILGRIRTAFEFVEDGTMRLAHHL